MLIRILLASLAVACWASAAAPTLVRVGDFWRYSVGVQEPSTEAGAWRSTDFDDSRWPAGPSGLGYGGSDNATILMPIPSPPGALWIRRQFQLEDPEAVKCLILRADYVDGFVAYLNGTEIARRNLDGVTNAPIPADVVAWPRLAGVPEDIDVSAGIPQLRVGTNVLAIECKLANPPPYRFLITPELLANFTRGPVVENASTKRIQIVWKTFYPGDSTVEYGTSTNLEMAVTDTNLVQTHVVSLSDLTPDTPYYYRVRSGQGGQVAVSPIYGFQTLRMAGPLTFLVVADTGWGTSPQYKMAEVMRAANPDLVLHAGDVVYPSLTAAQMDLKCFSVYQPQMCAVPFYFVAGNHDYYNNPLDYRAAFYLPTNNVTGTSDFYSFDHGDAHFAMLDSVFASGIDYAPGSPQYRWLEADLAGSNKPWKFLVFHNTIHTSGPHDSDDYNYNGIPDMLELQQSVGVLAARYHVQAIFTGHSHAYERFAPVNGTHTVVTGGGGAGLYYFTGVWDPTAAEYLSVYNCLKVTIEGDTLEIQTLGNGTIYDTMTIQKSIPPAQTYEASWHAPVVEAASTNTWDGNVVSQSFDLIGAPIRALAGGFANLGSLYVNNDAQTLYLGFGSAMITTNQDICLFIESPRQTGVTNLIGLAVGDPDSIALGRLTNLVFTDFAPTVGCLLGDKYADGQARQWMRPNRIANTGQGAFVLQPGLPSVAGVRLQQFNLSPQYYGVWGASNASFIKIAIPFSELGGLEPGDYIRVAAVVADSRDEPRGGAPIFDTGFLGVSFANGEDGARTLEGVEVVLAQPPFPLDLDSDNDGLTDNWEIANGLNPNANIGDNEAAADPDFDGLSNFQEQMAGTDPRDASSTLRLSVEIQDEGRLRLSWPTVAGKRYQLEFAVGKTSAFVPIADPSFPRIATRAMEAFVDDPSQRSSSAGACFYRVRLVP